MLIWKSFSEQVAQCVYKRPFDLIHYDSSALWRDKTPSWSCGQNSCEREFSTQSREKLTDTVLYGVRPSKEKSEANPSSSGQFSVGKGKVFHHVEFIPLLVSVLYIPKGFLDGPRFMRPFISWVGAELRKTMNNSSGQWISLMIGWLRRRFT